MADEAGVMFDADGKATPLLIARWRAKGAQAAIQPGVPLLDADRAPTGPFQNFWRAAFPARRDLPDVVAGPDGKFTNAMLVVWR